MARLVGMCGLSFSGKTTLARLISRLLEAEYVSTDDINEQRGLFGGEGISGEEWERTSAMAVERLGAALHAGRDAVLDDTLCFRWLRDRYARLAESCGASFVLVHVATPLSEIREAITRNEATRKRNPIRSEVFEAHAGAFEYPTPEERALLYRRTADAREWVTRNLATPPE